MLKMTLCSGMNKVAPKLTIIFQLTIWSIVGIILLQKGTISLYERTKARNDTHGAQQGKFTRWGKEESTTKSTIAGRRSQTFKSQAGTSVPSEAAVTLDNDSDESYRVASETAKRTSIVKRRTTIRYTDDTRDVRSIETLTISTENVNEGEDKYGLNESTASILREPNNFTSILDDSDESPSREEDEQKDGEPGKEKKGERKSRRAPMNRVGAAIAIVMLAIGIVMLLLGPLIVIVRAFTCRHRSRDLLVKSRCYDDQPPSYEEATLMDQAPRYSTLQLDTIDHPSSSSL